MYLLFKIAKSIITTIMVATLFINLFMLYANSLIKKALPTSVDELSELTITVKTAAISPIVQIITPVEYPTMFEIQGGLSKEVVAKSLINPGDKIGIYLSKKEAQPLESKSPQTPPVTIGYGITLQNGAELVDPVDVLAGKTQNERQKSLCKVIAIPVVYFLLLIVLPIARKRLLNKKTDQDSNLPSL